MDSRNAVIAIMGATGNVGLKIVDELIKDGKEVRALGRNKEKLKLLEKKGAKIFSLNFDNHDALVEAFDGAHAAFTMIPPDYSTGDHLDFQRRIGESICRALKNSTIKYVVNLSSLGANIHESVGPIRGLHYQERRLERVPEIHIVHLRAAYFMENLFWAVPNLRASSTFATTLRPDIHLPMVATCDVGRKAADLLRSLNFSETTVLEFFGPQVVMPRVIPQVLGEAIGKPNLKYLHMNLDEAARSMLASGLNSDAVHLLLELEGAINEGKMNPTQSLTFENRGNTTLAVFAKAIFLPKFHGNLENISQRISA